MRPLVLALGLCAISAAEVSAQEAGRKTPYFPDAVVEIRAEDLPEPFHSPSANNPPRVVTAPEGAGFTVPPGYAVDLFAEGLAMPRALCIAPNGDVFVSESHAGRVTVLRDADGDGVPEVRETFLGDLNLPFGIAFDAEHVYVANTDSVVRVPYEVGDLTARGEPETIVSDLPGGGYRQHWTRNLLFDPRREHLFISVGSRTNVGIEESPRASILRCNPDGSSLEVFATGLRNPVGLAWNPVRDELWTTVNERDGLGDDLVPDYLTSVRRGGFYGWPFSYLGARRDPRVPGGDDVVARATAPDFLIQAHSAALGLCFYDGAMFPEEVHGDAFIALHGSWNRSARTGYSVIRVPFGPDGRPLGWYEHFLRGFLLDPHDERVWGRPVDVKVAADGALLVTDDGGNRIWRVRWEAP